jgi:phenylalanyl-tRNA synthetase beta chain
MKGVIETLVAGLYIQGVSYRTSEHTSYFPGRAADLLLVGEPVGTFGELHPLVCEAFGLSGRVILAAELDLDALLAGISGAVALQPVSNYPAIYQDIAVVVDETVPAAEVEAAIREAGGWLLRGIRLFDVYYGQQIGEGKKSLAYALTFQADDRTLRDEDADRIRSKIVRTLEKQCGAHLRT